MEAEAAHIALATVVVLIWLAIVFGWFCTWERDTRESSHSARFADRRSDTHEKNTAA